MPRFPGVIYLDLTAEAIDRLDIFEGKHYNDKMCRLSLKIMALSTAMTYVIKPRYRDLLTGEEWSFSDFLAVGKKKFEKSFLGFWIFNWKFFLRMP